MKAVSAMIVTTLIGLAGCSSSSQTHIAPKDLLILINEHKSPVIIDVRTEGEYNKGHVPGAIHIAFWKSFGTDRLEAYPEDTDLVLYCAHGPRAGVAKLAYSLAGFENIRYMTGHMTAWYKAGYDVEK